GCSSGRSQIPGEIARPQSRATRLRTGGTPAWCTRQPGASSKHPAEEFEALVGGFLRVLPVGVKLDGEEALILDLFEGALEGGPVERALAGDHVVVLAAGDVFDVQVPDAVVEQLDCL